VSNNVHPTVNHLNSKSILHEIATKAATLLAVFSSTAAAQAVTMDAVHFGQPPALNPGRP
jgi:hypothetical protein